MSQLRALVVYKESTYSRYGATQHVVRGFKKNKYWSVLKASHDRHGSALVTVCDVLRERGFHLTTLLRSRVKSLSSMDRRFDLVVSVGGDGTFLECSHYLWRTPILGVNSDPRQSVARLSGSNAKNFSQILDRYLAGNIKPVSLWRLDFWVNGRKNAIPVLNDLLISTLSPAGTSRYIVKVGKQVEEQMSSGVWISAAAGSTAAALSAGGKAFPATAKKFQFIAREVYQKKFGPRHLLRQVIASNQTLEIVSYMRKGRLFIDGANLVESFQVGDRLKVKLSPKPLKVIGLKA